MREIVLRTGVWYDDRTFTLTFSKSWDVRTYFPDTPPPLTEDEILQKICNPIGQPPLSERARGKTKPIIVTDDLSRPTPVNCIMPFVLDQFRSAGVELQNIRILVAAGTHGKQSLPALKTKLGSECFESCRVLIHYDKKNTQLIGKTSFGTPVYVNREAIDSDLLVGIGGIYHQYTSGFGGGGKLALGILGRKSISHLHFYYGSGDGEYSIDNDFRRNVTEVCQMIGLDSIYTVHVNADLKVVNLFCGDHYAYYRDAAKFSREVYDAPMPDDADVVIANGYPSDVSYTFMRKGNRPILVAPKHAVKIMIGSNPEGLGNHGLYPQGKSKQYLALKAILDRVRIMETRVIIQKVIKNLPFMKKKKAESNQNEVSESTYSVDTSNANDTLWVYNPDATSGPMPAISEVKIFSQWDSILAVIGDTFPGRTDIRVRIYPCAPLQCLEPAGTTETKETVD